MSTRNTSERKRRRVDLEEGVANQSEEEEENVRQVQQRQVHHYHNNDQEQEDDDTGGKNVEEEENGDDSSGDDSDKEGHDDDEEEEQAQQSGEEIGSGEEDGKSDDDVKDEEEELDKEEDKSDSSQNENTVGSGIMRNTLGKVVPHQYPSDADGNKLCKFGCGQKLKSNPHLHAKLVCPLNPNSLANSKKREEIVEPQQNVYPMSVYRSTYAPIPPFSFEIPVMHPTMEEMEMGIVRYVTEVVENRERHHENFSVVKIRPPDEWISQATISPIEFTGPLTPKLQRYNMIEQSDGNAYRLESYNFYKMSGQYYRRKANSYLMLPPKGLEKTSVFWDRKFLSIIGPLYGQDVPNSGSFFRKECEFWNFSKLRSILNVCESQFPERTVLGITSVYAYAASWATGYSTHMEDMNTYSINYLHDAEPNGGKEWYTTRPKCTAKYIDALRLEFPDDFAACPAAYRHKLMFPTPNMMQKYNIPLAKVVQEKGDFIVAFPGTFHWGFNRGYNIAEAVNFGTIRWIPIAREAQLCDKTNCNYDDLRFDMDRFENDLVYDLKKKRRNALSPDEKKYLADRIEADLKASGEAEECQKASSTRTSRSPNQGRTKPGKTYVRY